ncbi:hypothetical protein ACFZ8E_08745 [Methylobacterium sp. HMF5984]|uniref:hypothetical protein n=1 Tax=unclassified Methylobacterium TaxID=2615210 RepID=UPI0028BF172A|nr:hypothetical protein [Methylobacterium sp. E-041]
MGKLRGIMIGYRELILMAAAAIALPSAVQAQETGELLRNTLSGIGLLEKPQAPIEYRERAPLVMPPKLDGKSLPAPRAGAASAQWPKEPEVVERERAAAERRLPKGSQAQGRYEDNNATLSIDEMRSGRRADANLTREIERKPGENSREDSWVNPLDLIRGIGNEKTEPAAAEPSRDVLTDPPKGYRQPPRKIVRNTTDPINNPTRERDEADPGVYLREQRAR